MYSQAAHGAGRASSGRKQTELVAAGGSKVLAASEKAAFLKSHQKVGASFFFLFIPPWQSKGGEYEATCGSEALRFGLAEAKNI